MPQDDLQPIGDLMADLRSLVAKKATGTYCLVTDENHFAMVLIQNGAVLDISYKRQHNEKALDLLRTVNMAKASFKPGALPEKNRVKPAADTVEALLNGGFEAQPVVPSRPAAGGAAGNMSEEQRASIMELAASYMGPFASVVCDEAFSNSTAIEKVVDEIASNIPDDSDADRFRAEIFRKLDAG